MSAIRGTDRRAARSHNSSPYTRQAPKKKSSWSFGIGDLLSYINPLRSRRSSESEDEDEGEIIEESQASAQPNNIPSPTDAVIVSPNDLSAPVNPKVAQNPAASLADRGHQLASSLNGAQQTPGRAHAGVELMFSTPPRVAAVSATDDAQLSPAESLEKVQKFLKEKDGQALSEWETRGLLTFLEKNVQHDNEKPEPFRFSSSPSRTPRSNSPVFGFGTPDAPPATNGDTTTPRKTLSKNPNGVYRWQGGGSARPRNRYHSPAFGTRPSPPTIKLSPAKTDTKRRRVGEEADKSSAQRVPFPAVSPQKPETSTTSGPAPTPAPSQTRPNIFPPQNDTPTTPNGTTSAAPKANGASAPRLRTTGLPTKPTAPTVPSPLRQTWGQSDSPPQTPASKPIPTKAASFMTELIKEVTPPKKPDLSNPYQTASPVRPTPRKPVAKRQRPPAKPAAPPPAPVKTPEPSAQAVIEATVPKGSKRSRPPPELMKSTRADAIPAPSRRSPRSQTSDLPFINGFNGTSGTQTSPVVVEEVIDEDGDDDKRTTKKQKTNSQKVTMEEIDDEEAVAIFRPSERYWSATSSDSSSSSSKPAQPASSSNLFTSNAGTPLKSAFATKSSAPKEPSKLRFSYQVDKNNSPPSTSDAPPPVTSFTPPPAPRFMPAQLPAVLKGPTNVDPKQAAIAMALDDLPAYTFPAHLPQPCLFADAQEAAKAKPVASLPTFNFSASPTLNGFDWAAAGSKPRNTPSGGSWECGYCMCNNTADAKDKCAICDSPRSKPSATPVVKGFDWAAAGAKAPPTASSTWTCSLCMLLNPETANKCIVCDATR